MAKFVLYIDFESPKSYEYRKMESRTIEDAIEEADKIRYKTNKENPVYLVRIMKKVGTIVKPYRDGYSYETYEAILCKRFTWWHKNTKENREEYHSVNLWWKNNDKSNFWFER